MSYRLTWMPSALKRYGLKVVLIDGWQNRGHGDVGTTTGVLGHHTAGSAHGNYPSLNIVTHGRSDLPGPLCNLGLARNGTVVVVAAGLAYHAGSGSLPFAPGASGNEHLIGIEAESTGVGGDWTNEQKQAYPAMAAALLDWLNLGADRFVFHKNYAPSRKIDVEGWPGDLDGFRGSIKKAFAHKGIERMKPIEPKPGETLRMGDSGGKVMWLQGQLNADLQHPPGVAVTGKFGPATRHAVARFQREQQDLRGFGTNPKLAGLAGPKTIARLKSYSD